MPFPVGYTRKDINDICVTSLDTFAAGCITAYTGDGTLDKKRLIILKSCLNDLDCIIPKLDKGSKDYFTLLKEISVAIVKNAKISIIYKITLLCS